MKRFTIVLLAIVTVFAFVSCSMDKVQNEPVSINIKVKEESPKSLTALLDFSVTELTWKYTAEKKDNGLTTGQQEEQTDLKENKTLTLSQGYWDFTLYGYKKIDNEEKLICKGSVLGKLIDKQNTSIFISVQPMQTKDVNGTIVIELTNDAEVTVKRLSDETTVSGSSPYTVSSGTYVVEVKTTTTDGAESTALKYINVYDYLTTTVKGDVTT